MENRRPITEDDIYLTEMLLARSYGHLKGSVIRSSSEALGSFGEVFGGTVRRHPHAAAGAAIGAGLLLFLLAKLTGGGEPSRRSAAAREERPRSSPAMDLLGMLLPFVTPYITAYIGRAFGMGGKERT